MFWEKKGKSNTENTLNLAVKRAEELKIKHIVVASCSGETAEKLFLKAQGKNINIVCITHQIGFESPGSDEMDPETRKRLSEKGIKLLTTTHLLAGVDRAVRNKFGGVYPSEIMAQTLRIFGQGIKVCVEIAGMAMDAGLVPAGEEIITIGGSGEGADAAVVVLPAHSQHFFNTQVREIICMPREK